VFSVWIYPEQGIVHHTMKTYCYGESFREALTRGSEAMKLHKATKWLSDDRASGPVPAEDSEWSQTNWFPQTKAAGWKYWAIVPPEKILGQLKIERISKMYSERGINRRMFQTPEEALKWLGEV